MADDIQTAQRMTMALDAVDEARYQLLRVINLVSEEDPIPFKASELAVKTVRDLAKLADQLELVKAVGA